MRTTAISWRLPQRVLKLEPESLTDIQKSLYRKTQQTTDRVKRDILGGTFHFNTAISALMELVNEIHLYMDGDPRIHISAATRLRAI